MSPHVDPKALESIGQRCSSVQPQNRRVAHHHLKVQGTAGHCFITLTGQRNLAMRNHRNKIALNHNWNQPTKQTANYNISDTKNSRRSPMRPKQTASTRAMALVRKHTAFPKKARLLGGRSCFGIISSIPSCVAWQLSRIVLSQRDFRLNGITTHADRWLTLVPFFLRDPGSKIFCSNSIVLQNTLPPLRISIAQSLTYKSSYSHLLPCRKICVA